MRAALVTLVATARPVLTRSRFAPVASATASRRDLQLELLPRLDPVGAVRD
jgi:hypothetical protein